MKIEIEHQDAGYKLVRLIGELRREATAKIEDELHPLIAPKGTALIINLSELETVDSSGLSQLVGLATHARLSESKVVLFGATPFVAGVFEVTRLDKWFDMAADLTDAENRLGIA